jgi:hypothetical protein
MEDAMATRFYINFKDVESEEKYLRISPGSVHRLQTIDFDLIPGFKEYAAELADEIGTPDPDFAKYKWLADHEPELRKLTMFHLFGLGRITAEVYEKIEGLGMDPVVGEIHDQEMVKEFLQLQHLPPLEGVKSIYWS